ncbi:hypothetical protein TCDM_01109 [Trypanosoma cruzi Dm28c]|uniref:Uncharacterized protein n=2 Tax=Trypanosoma cruzi TaxID=5693 RepID=V5BUV6_TRYCR|nr:hypothetical protein TCDM_01109 [Trypanosoma cruzi Dm28c]KAF8288944.1 hypothetical protein TcBrA4_0003050 [Trypanosoma cruzi]PBJ71998.1 hypothetical protein BCY84_16220 [Trypanosoma cruzi cruzi]PWU98059.1 hypothetical protein C4B63_13g267 [Trypanosoma cruzi]
MKTNSLADNRALLQVLSLSENTELTPTDILSCAIVGGVVGIFTDEKKRYVDSVLLPSSRDLTTLATFIAEGFFAPFLRSALGDHLPRYTIIAESGCFEALSLPVILFPDCFLLLPSPYVASPNNTTPPVFPFGGGTVNVSLDSFSMASVSSVPTEVADVLQLHQHRSHVALLLLKNVNEILRDAEVWKLKVSKEKMTAGTSEMAAINAVMALFYEVKMLLLCCLVSSKKAYTVEKDFFTGSHNSAQKYFSELFSPDELCRIFDHKRRSSAEHVEKWYDAMMTTLIDGVSAQDSELQAYIHELQRSLAEDERRITGAPMYLLHRPHDAASTTLIHLACVHSELPSLELQPGEMFLLLDPLGESLLFDAEPSKLCTLLRRCALVKLTVTQLRDVERILASSPWCELCDTVVESVQYHLNNDAFLSVVLEKNSSFLVKLVRWLRGIPAAEEDGTMVRSTETRQQEVLGVSMANHIIEYVIHFSSFGAAIAQFIREVVSCTEISEPQLHTWVDRSIIELENKPSAAVGLFALVVAFSLAQRGWDLPEATRESAIRLCTQHKQQPNCVTLLNLLRRHSQ